MYVFFWDLCKPNAILATFIVTFHELISFTCLRSAHPFTIQDKGIWRCYLFLAWAWVDLFVRLNSGSVQQLGQYHGLGMKPISKHDNFITGHLALQQLAVSSPVTARQKQKEWASVGLISTMSCFLVYHLPKTSRNMQVLQKLVTLGKTATQWPLSEKFDYVTSFASSPCPNVHTIKSQYSLFHVNNCCCTWK